MNLEKMVQPDGEKQNDVFAERLAARRREEVRIGKMRAAGFNRGDVIEFDGEEWQLWDTYGDENGEGVKAYKMDPQTKKVSGEKKISFDELTLFKEKAKKAA